MTWRGILIIYKLMISNKVGVFQVTSVYVCMYVLNVAFDFVGQIFADGPKHVPIANQRAY